MPFNKILNNIKRTCSLEEQEEREIVAHLRIIKFPRKEIVINKGETNSPIFFVNKGLVKTLEVGPDSIPHVISFAPEDHWVCDMQSYGTPTPSTIVVQCLESSELVFISQESFEYLIKAIPKFSNHMHVLMRNRIAALERDRLALISKNAESRYKYFIEENRELFSRVTLKDVASYLGIFPESLSRIRRHMAMD
jgi:CRP-like cAMP-binding protein